MPPFLFVAAEFLCCCFFVCLFASDSHKIIISLSLSSHESWSCCWPGLCIGVDGVAFAASTADPSAALGAATVVGRNDGGGLSRKPLPYPALGGGYVTPGCVARC